MLCGFWGVDGSKFGGAGREGRLRGLENLAQAAAAAATLAGASVISRDRRAAGESWDDRHLGAQSAGDSRPHTLSQGLWPKPPIKQTPILTKASSPHPAHRAPHSIILARYGGTHLSAAGRRMKTEHAQATCRLPGGIRPRAATLSSNREPQGPNPTCCGPSCGNPNPLSHCTASGPVVSPSSCKVSQET